MTSQHPAGTGVHLLPDPVELATLKTGLSPRSRPLDHAYVATLLEVLDNLPPILVHLDSRTVVDGAHRVAAHQAAGRHTIAVQWLHCSWDEAFAAGVRANVMHGLPLTLAERRSAARTLLTTLHDRSDRWIGDVCGLSHSTIAKLRAKRDDDYVAEPASARVGRDGRTRRPPRRAESKGVDVVHDAAGNSTAPTPSPPSADAAHRDQRRGAAEDLRSVDLATLQSTAELASFARWLAVSDIRDADWEIAARQIPLGRVYEVADDARRRAEAWARLASTLEQRARSRRASPT